MRHVAQKVCADPVADLPEPVVNLYQLINLSIFLASVSINLLDHLHLSIFPLQTLEPDWVLKYTYCCALLGTII